MTIPQEKEVSAELARLIPGGTELAAIAAECRLSAYVGQEISAEEAWASIVRGAIEAGRLAELLQQVLDRRGPSALLQKLLADGLSGHRRAVVDLVERWSERIDRDRADFGDLVDSLQLTIGSSARESAGLLIPILPGQSEDGEAGSWGVALTYDSAELWSVAILWRRYLPSSRIYAAAHLVGQQPVGATPLITVVGDQEPGPEEIAIIASLIDESWEAAKTLSHKSSVHEGQERAR